MASEQLTWEETRPIAKNIRSLATEQLFSLWRKVRDINGSLPTWGDEIECILVHFDEAQKDATLALKQKRVLEASAEDDQGKDALPNGATKSSNNGYELQPEYGACMVESVPAKPYGAELRNLLDAELNMRERRQVIKKYLSSSEEPITIPMFPRLGVTGREATASDSQQTKNLDSEFISNDLLSDYTRYSTISENIKARKGAQVSGSLPVFKDVNTPWPWKDPTVNQQNKRDEHSFAPNSVYADHTAFGAIGCGLQITFQAGNIDQARYLHDQLCPLGGIMLALTAGTPIFKGFIVDTDVRWNNTVAMTDDRNKKEDPRQSNNGKRLAKPHSRWSACTNYISNDRRLRPEYMQTELAIDEKVFERLTSGGMDTTLASHFANALSHDPLLVPKDDLQDPTTADTNFFDAIYGTNWTHVRFKPPPRDGSSGWKLEFRPMEVQITDFENAAFCIFIVLVCRTIVQKDLNLYIPISKVAENMERAHTRDAINREKFWFRNNPYSRHGETNGDDSSSTLLANSGTTKRGNVASEAGDLDEIDEFSLMTTSEVINGPSTSSSSSFPGLLPLIRAYLSSLEIEETLSPDQTQQLNTYLEFIAKRASGEFWTPAKWMRHVVDTHPQYGHDSVVGQEVAYEILTRVRGMGQGRTEDRGLISGNLGIGA